MGLSTAGTADGIAPGAGVAAMMAHVFCADGRQRTETLSRTRRRRDRASGSVSWLYYN
jgi:hypothetical protein